MLVIGLAHGPRRYSELLERAGGISKALLPAQRVALLGAALGRDLRFEGLPDDVARREMSTSMPGPLADAFFEFSRGGTYLDGYVGDQAPALLRRALRTFTGWARAHGGAFG